MPLLGDSCHAILQVKSRDHQFDSVSHLVNYFTTREIPLVIGKNQVFLRRAIVNAFPRQ